MPAPGDLAPRSGDRAAVLSGFGGPGSKPLPEPVRRELARRRVDLFAQVDPVRTLDLGAVDLGLPAGPSVAEPDRHAPIDAIVGIARLATHPDPAGLLAACFELLHPNGRLLLVEPYRRPGLTGRVQAAAAATIARRFGCRVDLPVPALVRSAGFVIATIERFTMPTALVPLRPFVFVDARAGIVPTAEATR